MRSQAKVNAALSSGPPGQGQDPSPVQEADAVNGGLIARLDAILRATPNLMTVLEIARALDLPDGLIVSGAIYQPVLNHLTGRPLDFGIKRLRPGLFRPPRPVLRGRGCGDPPRGHRFRTALYVT